MLFSNVLFNIGLEFLPIDTKKYDVSIDDLQLDKEIIPFFDISLNRYSKEALRTLFYEFPADQTEALERQQIIQGFISSLSAIKGLYSYKPDIIDCYDFCKNFQVDQADLFRSIVNFKIGHWLDRKRTEQLSAKFFQLSFLMDRIYQHYFQRLKIEGFPVSFARQITTMVDLLNDMRGLVKEGGLGGSGRLAGKMNFRILKKMASFFDKNKFDAFWNNFFLFEAYLSISTIAAEKQLSIPTFVQAGIKLDEFYHPLLRDPVKNSIDLKHNVVLLTGPNMSGKSTFLRSVSLCIYLGRIGLPVPARKAEMVFVDDLDVFISSKDDLAKGYSHFMMEVQSFKSVVVKAGAHRVFAVFDEMFSGTNSEDAVNILRIALKGITRFKQSFFLISTHYRLEELAITEADPIELLYIASDISNGIPQFTYEVKKGNSDLRLGMILFENEGLLQLLSPSDEP